MKMANQRKSFLVVVPWKKGKKEKKQNNKTNKIEI